MIVFALRARTSVGVSALLPMALDKTTHFGVDIISSPRFRKLSWVSDSDFLLGDRAIVRANLSLAEANFSLKPFGSYIIRND